MLNYQILSELLERVKSELRDYQHEAINHAIQHKHTLFDMYMGMGKTLCAMISTLHHKPKKVLVLCPRNALGAWLSCVEEWFPEYAVAEEFNILRAKGNKKKRLKQWEKESTFYICTYQTYLADYDHIKNIHKFDVYNIDEVHKIPSHTTKTFKALEKCLRNIPIKYLLTGTWIKRNASYGWRHLHLLDRDEFSSFWKFKNTYCQMLNYGFGQEVVGPKNISLFKQVIKPYVYRNHAKEGNIPKSTRQIEFVDMNTQQQKIYHQLDEHLMAELPKEGLILTPTVLSKYTKHRQLLALPEMIDPVLGLGSAFHGLITLLREYEKDPEEQHCVIFSPFRKAVEKYAGHLRDFKYPVFTFLGGDDGQKVFERAKEFRALKGKKSIAICTMDFAESYDLGSSTRSHFIGLHTDPEIMKQAEARLARASSDLSKIIVHRYWLYNKTIDIERRHVINERSNHISKLFSLIDQE